MKKIEQKKENILATIEEGNVDRLKELLEDVSIAILTEEEILLSAIRTKNREVINQVIEYQQKHNDNDNRDKVREDINEVLSVILGEKYDLSRRVDVVDVDVNFRITINNNTDNENNSDSNNSNENKIQENRLTGLMIAVKLGLDDRASILSDLGADLSLVDSNGNTSLVIAAIEGSS